MADVIGHLTVRFETDTTALGFASTELKKVAATANAVSTGMAKNWNNAGRSMQYFGWYASMYLTAPITIFGIASMKAAKDFEFSMAKIIGLVGESKQQVAQWSESILKLGPSLGQMPKALAEGMYFITSSGFKGAEAMDILEKSAKAAATGLGDVNKIADFTTSVLNAYAGTGLSAAKVMDILTAAVREGKLEAASFTQEIGQVIPVAAEMGVQFDELAAAMASMSLTGTNASQGAVYLRGILNSLLDPAKEAEDSLRLMGTSGEELRKVISEQGLLPALKKISDLTAKYGENMVSKVIPNVRAMTGFMSLLGKNYEHNLEIFRQVYASTGDMNKAFEAVANTIQFKWNQSLATMQAALIKVGLAMKDLLLPILEVLTKAISGLADWFSELPPVARAVIGVLTGITAALGPLAAGIGFMIRYVIPAFIVGWNAMISGLSAMGPIAWGVIAILAAISIAYAKSQRETQKAATAQAEMNKQLEIFNQLKADVKDIGTSMIMVNTMNRRQLETLAGRIQNQKEQEEDYTVFLKGELQKRLWADEQLKKLQQDYDKSSTVQAKVAAAALIEVRRNQIAQELESQYQGNQQSLKQLKEYQTQVEAAIKRLPEVHVKNPGIAEAMANMKLEEAVINAMIPLMKKAGKEYDANAEYTSLYVKTLKELVTYGREAAAEQEQVAKKLAQVGESTKRTTKIMDDLAGELAFIKAMGSLGWSTDQTNVESLNAFTNALEKMAKAGVVSGKDIEYLRGMISTFNREVNGVGPIMKDLADQMTVADYMGGLLGNSYDLAGAKVSILTSRIEELRSSIQKDNTDLLYKILLLQKLSKELEQAQLAQYNHNKEMLISQGIVSGTIDIINALGTAIGEGANAFQALAGAVLQATGQIINALLEQAIANIILADSEMLVKEAKKGLPGLILAAVGIAAITAMMAGAKSSAKQAAKMAGGGVVPPGYPHDTYPALLTSGETVTPPKKLRDTGSHIVVDDIIVDGRKLRIVLKNTEEYMKQVL
jgi:TP901 family phage tail tape measure protein